MAEAHNLEHGGVIVQYGDKIGATTRMRLRAFYDDSPNAMVLAPLPELGSKITLTAWTHPAHVQGVRRVRVFGLPQRLPWERLGSISD